MTIPYNSKIVKAVVEFTGYSPADGLDTDVQCHFEDADNSSAPSDKADLDTRVLTSGVPWENIEEWKDNYAYQTPQLRDILQGVINRAGWVSGNNILFTAKNDGLDSYRLWSAIEHRGGLERARLKVSWIAPKKLDPPIIEPVETFQVGAFDCTIRVFPTDASIYYTLDGSNPNTNDILYTGPFQITSSKEVRARAYKDYWTYSDIASRDYTLYIVYVPVLIWEGLSFLSVNAYVGYVVRADVGDPEVDWSAEFRTALWRFTSISIPKDAIIESATITFNAYQSGTYAPLVFDLGFEASDNPSAPVTVDNMKSILSNMTSIVEWTPDIVWSQGVDQTTADIKTALQELINRAGWSSGNAANFVMYMSSPDIESINPPENFWNYYTRPIYGWGPQFSTRGPTLDVVWSSPGGSGSFTSPEVSTEQRLYIVRYYYYG